MFTPTTSHTYNTLADQSVDLLLDKRTHFGARARVQTRLKHDVMVASPALKGARARIQTRMGSGTLVEAAILGDRSVLLLAPEENRVCMTPFTCTDSAWMLCSTHTGLLARDFDEHSQQGRMLNDILIQHQAWTKEPWISLDEAALLTDPKPFFPKINPMASLTGPQSPSTLTGTLLQEMAGQEGEPLVKAVLLALGDILTWTALTLERLVLQNPQSLDMEATMETRFGFGFGAQERHNRVGRPRLLVERTASPELKNAVRNHDAIQGVGGDVQRALAQDGHKALKGLDLVVHRALLNHGATVQDAATLLSHWERHFCSKAVFVPQDIVAGDKEENPHHNTMAVRTQPFCFRAKDHLRSLSGHERLDIQRLGTDIAA